VSASVRRVLAVVLVVAASCSQRPSFVYLYDCGGTITKFDLATKTQIARWRPVDIAGLSDVVALPVRDGCLLNNVRYLAASGRLVAVAPLSPVTTAEATERHALLLIDVTNMRLVAHTELPRSATTPNLMLPDSHQIRVGYELPHGSEPNESWTANYAAATLELAGPPQLGAPLPTVSAGPIPPEIPVPDKFTYPVFADR
jgi:hypothetical protein